MYQILNPIQAGPLSLRNRIAYLGMAKNLSTPDNFVTERQIAYYTNYAKKGVALITTGACIVFDDYPSRLPCQPGLYDDKFIPGLKKLADSVHAYGAKLLLQLWHPGKAAYGCTLEQTKYPHEFSLDEIHRMQDQFVEAMRRAKDAGMDGCEWHMAHNYLAEEFAAPYFNKRTDQYGADTPENAARFSAEILDRARTVCGEGFALTLKINGWDMGVEGGMTPERCAAICRELEKHGICLISVSAGGGLTDITGMSGDGHRAEGWKIDMAETVKKAVHVPVEATGSIRHVDVMENALRSGKCDMIGMGRGLLAEPEFVKKVQEDRLQEMRYCISCMNCFIPYNGDAGHCAVNPVATFESIEPELRRDGNGRTVAVIGAGPAGVEAAQVLAKRGFRVKLLEKDGHVGGSVYHAAIPYGKEKLNWALEVYRHQLTEAGVEVLTNTAATPDRIRAMQPYAVFVASGTTPIIPRSIPGIDKPIVKEAKVFLESGPVCAETHTAVIGGGLVGLEVAATLAVNGEAVTVVEMLPADRMKPTMPYILALRHAREAGCTLLYGNRLTEVTDSGIMVEDEAGQRRKIDARRVLLCLGYRPNKELYEKLAAEMERVFWLGTEEGIGDIPEAIRRGHKAAMNLN